MLIDFGLFPAADVFSEILNFGVVSPTVSEVYQKEEVCCCRVISQYFVRKYVIFLRVC